MGSWRTSFICLMFSHGRIGIEGSKILAWLRHRPWSQQRTKCKVIQAKSMQQPMWWKSALNLVKYNKTVLHIFYIMHKLQNLNKLRSKLYILSSTAMKRQVLQSINNVKAFSLLKHPWIGMRCTSYSICCLRVIPSFVRGWWCFYEERRKKAARLRNRNAIAKIFEGSLLIISLIWIWLLQSVWYDI